MAYQSWSVVAFEQPTAAKWNILGSNDSSFNDGSGLPTGTCVQIATTTSGAVATGTTTIPMDDTIPQSGEGTEFLTLAITPRFATSKLVVEAIFFGALSITGDLIVALFRDAGADAITASVFHEANDERRCVKLTAIVTASAVTATTFKMRAGGNSASTVTFNGASGGRLLGTVAKSSIVIREYTA